MLYTYRPKGVCAQMMKIELEDGVIKEVQVLGGCNGNLKGIGALVEGMNVDDVIARISGISCGGRPTSCPDQLAQALKAAKANA